MIPVGFGVVALVAAVAWWWFVPRLRAWPPALGLLVAVFTVVPPHQVVGLGIGMDDVLFLLGFLLLVPSAISQLRHAPRPVPFGRVLAVGTGLLVAGTTISAFVNADTAAGTLDLLLRGPVRLLLYAAMVVVLVAQSPRELTRAVVARALAGVGAFEAVFSVVAYAVPLPGGFGLEGVQGNTSLVGEIPGRVTGTLGLSPNFLGALLVLAIPVSLGLALDARAAWVRIGWATAVVAQVAAVVLTYTRSSLAVVFLACVVLIGLRGRVRWLAAGAVVLVGLLVFTPAFERVVHDHTDRMALYASALRVFADHPLAGVGPGEQARFTAADPTAYRLTEFGVAGNNAHNTILLAAAEDGILGLVGAVVLNLALVMVAVAVIRRARAVARLGDRRAEPLAVAIAVLAFLSQGMTNNLFTVTLTASALVMLVAGCALPWLEPAPVPGSRPRHALAASNEI